MGNHSRRKFIKGVALGGVASICLPSVETFANVASSEGKVRAKEGMVILFQGDSITDGNRGRNADPNHILGHGYQFSIGSRLGADYPEKKYVFYNRGISGNRVTDLEKRWQAEALDLKPDLLSILIGVNDCSSTIFHWGGGPGVSIEEYEKTYSGLLDQTRVAMPNVIFVLCEPFILPVGKVKENWDAYQADIIQRQAVVRKLAAKYDTIFVGFQDVFKKACERAAPEYWIWDGVHPTVAGHELMAREWLKQVEKRIKF